LVFKRLTFKVLFIFPYGVYLLLFVWVSQEIELFSSRITTRIWSILPYNVFEGECLSTKTIVFGFRNEVSDYAKCNYFAIQILKKDNQCV